MRDNHKGRKSRRLSQAQSEAPGDTRSLLNTTSPTTTGYLHYFPQEESSPKSQREESARKSTRRSKTRANHQSSEKSSTHQKAAEAVEKNSVRKRKDMEERRDLDMEETGDPDATMQTILRHLGSGFEIFAPQFGGQTSRIRSLISMMKSKDIGDQMAGISELCENLSVSTEDSMIMFPVDEVVPVLLELLDSSPDLMLLSCRAITLLVDVYPSSAKQISQAGGIETLCGKLVCIEYIDVAEQSIQALEKISRSYPEILLEKGALNVILSFVDFFQLGMQRLAVDAAAKICMAIQNVSFEQISTSVDSIVPLLRQLVFSSDSKICLSACDALTWIALGCKRGNQPTESTIGFEFLQQVAQEVVQPNSTRKPCVLYAMLGLLSVCASSSEKTCIYLLESDIIQVLSDILASLSSTNFGEKSKISLRPRDPEEIHVVLTLLDNMLPPVVPHDLRVFKSRSKQILRCLSRLELQSNIFQAPDGKQKEVREFIMRNTKQVDKFCGELIGPMLSIDFASLSSKSRVCLLSILDKLLFFSTSEYLLHMIGDSPISAFMIRLLQSSDCQWIFCCLKFVSSLLQKDIKFKTLLVREGVLSEMAKLDDRPQIVYPDGLAETCTWFVNRIRVCYLSDSEVDEDEMEGLLSLKKIKQQFPNLKALTDFLELIMEHSVSPFEVYKSGILEELYLFLSDETNTCRFSEAIGTFKRKSQMAEPLLDQNIESVECLERFIGIIQDVLMTCEQLPVYSTAVHSMQGSRSIRAHASRNVDRTFIREPRDPFDTGLRALANPLRIKLCCEDKGLDSNDATILIEPLATLSQVEAYLTPRIKQMLHAQSVEMKKNDNMRMTRSRARTLGYRDGMGKAKPGSSKAISDNELMKPDDNNDQADIGDEGVLSKEFSCEEQQNYHDVGNMDTLANSGDAEKVKDFYVIFSVDGVDLEPSTTLLKAFLDKEPQVVENFSLNLKHIWTQIHQLDFRVVFHQGDSTEPRNKNLSTAKESMDTTASFEGQIENILSREDEQVGFALGILNAVEKLWILAKSSRFLGDIDSSTKIKMHLVNNKVCSKLIKQLKDPLLVCSRALPGWCSMLPLKSRFLFSYDARSMYFRYHAFSLGRTVLAILEDAPWLSYGNDDSQDSFPFAAPRISRQKVRISRSHILESARKVFGRYANADSRLEVEFYGEVGSGLGPTLEFYTLLSREFQRANLSMWKGRVYSSHDKEIGMDFVSNSQGLFPKPLVPGLNERDSSRILANFSLLGQVVAKSIQDGRLLDIHFSKAFYKLAIHKTLDDQDLLEIDPELFKSLQEIKDSISNSNGSQVVVNGVPIEDLCLNFVLPGDETIELCPEGSENFVTSQNASQYVDSVFKYILFTGVEKQMRAFREGFNKIFPLHYLEIFYEDEIDLMVCGDINSDQWTFETILSAVRCDHGYSSDSKPVINLIETLVELDTDDKRRFLKFVTGSPRLPAGGYLALNPRLTIVRKGPDVSGPVSPKSIKAGKILTDNDLPSVMTCANYFKLPPYSSKEILKDRLLFAIREGQGSFDLS